MNFTTAGQNAEKRIKEGLLTNAAMAVYINGERVYRHICGYSDRERGTVLKEDGIFRLASMTKPITAVACMIACEKGLINIKDKVSDYFPEFENMYVGKMTDGKTEIDYKAKNPITVENILTHSSGLGSGEVGDIEYKNHLRKEGVGLVKTARGFSQMLLDFEPSTSQFYSACVALDVVAAIIEVTSGMPYEEFLKNYIFQPLDMTDTTYRLKGEQKQRLVKLYRLSEDKKTVLPEKDFGYSGFCTFPEGYPSGVAGLFSTLNDYSNFANMLALGGEYRGKRILSERSVKMLSEPKHPLGMQGITPYFNWGYGVRVVSAEKAGVQELPAGSYGWSGAYNTHFWVDPTNKLAAVYMSNLNDAGGADSETAREFEHDVMNGLNL